MKWLQNLQGINVFKELTYKMKRRYENGHTIYYL